MLCIFRLILGFACFTAFRFETPRHLTPGMAPEETYAEYYSPVKSLVYGYATRYGDKDLALRELLWSAHEYADQHEFGFGLLGGGYGYYEIGDSSYLVDNRASHGYYLLSQGEQPPPNENQRRLAMLANMTDEQAIEYVNSRYVGIVSLRSPNEIGSERCLLKLPSGEPVGLVIVGGTAARHDWSYFGPSVNDDFGHERMGSRVLTFDRQSYYWVADLPDNLFYSTWDGDSVALVAIGPGELCDYSQPICSIREDTYDASP